jgi:hypothetical protein
LGWYISTAATFTGVTALLGSICLWQPARAKKKATSVMYFIGLLQSALEFGASIPKCSQSLLIFGVGLLQADLRLKHVLSPTPPGPIAVCFATRRFSKEVS